MTESPASAQGAAPARPPPKPVTTPSNIAPSRQGTFDSTRSRSRTNSTTSSVRGRLRSLSMGFEESRIHGGFSAATAEIASSVFSLSDDASSPTSPHIVGRRRISTASRPIGTLLEEETRTSESTLDGATIEETEGRPGGLEEVRPVPVMGTSQTTIGQITRGEKAGPGPDEVTVDTAANAAVEGREKADAIAEAEAEAELTAPFDNGYHFPPSYSAKHNIRTGLLAFWRFFLTPWGFFWTLYGLNVVAWGGMLFLLLCNASPAMCYPTCNDINSPRRIWIEIDSQILNALFCVTGFGLAPWRFRDMYYLLKFRLTGNYLALRRLAGIHRSWIRLPGSEDLPIEFGVESLELEVEEDLSGGEQQYQLLPVGVPEKSIPYPLKATPRAPLTGIRAPPTKLWKVDLALWLNVSNTFLQCVLSGFMWGLNRYKRPTWSTGLFVALACIAAACGGLVMFLEGKKVKSIEGVPLTDEDREKLERDQELGIRHYNNIKDKKPKEKVADSSEEAGRLSSERKNILGRLGQRTSEEEG